jgi:hypothetical protein
MAIKLERYLCLIAGAIIMMNNAGCSSVKFEKYSSKDPLINISAEYISGWEYDESRGANNSYAQVMFYQFNKGRKSQRAIMAVTLKDNPKTGLNPLSVEAAAEDLLAKRKQFKDMKVLKKEKARLLNTEAVVIELSYSLPENLLDIKSKFILTREKVIIFNKDNKFYFLRYLNSAEEFDKYDSAFTHIVKTVRIKDKK